MKKIILLIALSLPLFLSAQLTSDDFESYTIGDFDSQWDATQWVGWFGGPSNTTISDEQASSGTNSLKVEMNDDVVALLGDLNEEGYQISFKQFIPSGNGAYFNFQHSYTNTAGSWMVESYATPDGVATFSSAGQTINYPIVYDEWAELSFLFDFITGQAQFSYNGTPIATFFIVATSNGIGLGSNQVNAINFFGACQPAGCTALAYYDDVEVTFVPAPPHNARVINPIPPSEYTTVPNGLEQPITLSADVWNIGAEDITNVTMTFNLKDGSGATIYTETTDPVMSIGSTEQVTFTGTGSYTLIGVDNYTMDYVVNIAETDADMADNTTTVQVPFAIDDNIYARDDGNYVGGGITVNNQTDPVLGQNFEFIDMATVDGILMAYEGSMVGEVVRGLIYFLDANGMPETVIATTEPYTLTEAGVAGAPVFITLDFAEDIVLPADTYMFAVQQVGTVSLNLSFSLNVFTPETVWAQLTDNTGSPVWNNLETLGIRAALAVRPLVSVVGTSIDESVNYVNELQIAPNPTQDIITIDLELLETQELTVEVYNTNGQRLKTFSDDRTIGGQYQLNLKEYPSGIYYVKFQIGEQVLSRRVVLTK